MCDDDVIFVKEVSSFDDLSSNSKKLTSSSYDRVQDAEHAINTAKSAFKKRCVSNESCPIIVNVEVQHHNQSGGEGESRRKSTRKARSCTKLQKLREKRKKAIEREISASIKSKCEQYIFCSVSRRVFSEFPEAELETRKLFAERNIIDQLVCDEERIDTNVYWRRKCIEAIEDNGDVVRNEYDVQQHIFAIVLSDKSLKDLIRRKTLGDFVSTQKSLFPVRNSSLILIVYGEEVGQIHDLSIDLFDNYRAQLHCVQNAQSFALYLAQISRALAKLQRSCTSTVKERLIFDVEKGVKDGPLDGLVRNWWEKMLAVISGMQGAQKRAIMSAYPNPFIASKKFLEMGHTDAVREIADVQTETGRRLGPAMAHRLFMILTDHSGAEIIY